MTCRIAHLPRRRSEIHGERIRSSEAQECAATQLASQKSSWELIAPSKAELYAKERRPAKTCLSSGTAGAARSGPVCSCLWNLNLRPAAHFLSPVHQHPQDNNVVYHTHCYISHTVLLIPSTPVYVRPVWSRRPTLRIRKEYSHHPASDLGRSAISFLSFLTPTRNNSCYG